MKAIAIQESHIALKHHANPEQRQQRCMKLIERLTFMKSDMANVLCSVITEADKFKENREACLFHASEYARAIKVIQNRTNRLINYYNSLILI
jgi:hypothetical protein